MAVSILSLPDEEPPSIGRYGSHGSHVSPALSARSFAPDLRAEQREDTSLTVPKAPFLQIFKQMEASTQYTTPQHLTDLTARNARRMKILSLK